MPNLQALSKIPANEDQKKLCALADISSNSRSDIVKRLIMDDQAQGLKSHIRNPIVHRIFWLC